MRNASLLLVVAVALAGCPSKEEELIKLRGDNRASKDALYAEYGGSAVASEFKKEANREVDKATARPVDEAGRGVALELAKLVGGAVGEVDRAAFETQCEEFGSGGRPVVISEKAKAYFARADVQKKCADIAARDLRIASLERELGVPAAP